MKRNWFYWYLMMFSMAVAVNSESFYSINAPGVLKSNRKYSVVVDLHDADGPCLIRVGITGPGFNDFKDATLQPFESKLFEFFPKKLLNAEYILKAESLSGLSFKNESHLNVITHEGPKIYIQTDKAFYSPQDTVRFRVLLLDEHTRPLNIKDPTHVEILDNDGNRVKQFKGINFTHGVYTGKFKLSKYPVLGNWKINVTIAGTYDYSSHKYIKIATYNLPKFRVYLKAPANILLEDGFLRVVIYGKFTFDKHVEGNARVQLWDSYEKTLFQSKQVDIQNLGFVDFNIKNITNIDGVDGFTIKAYLTEMYSGVTESEEQSVKLRKQRYDLIIPYEEIEFENNKPYRMNVYVKHWTGAPVLDRKTPVTMEHGDQIYEAFLNEKGLATFQFDHDPNADHKFQYKDSKSNFNNIYTNTNLMLSNREYYCRLTLVDSRLKLGKPVLIEVSSIVDIPYLKYILMGHASIIKTEYIKVPPNQKSYVISITPSIEMIPVSYIYVYYVHNGNLRYEEKSLRFPYELENQVSLSAPEQAKPAEDVTITINAQPKSFVSILAVDLGVNVQSNTYDLDKGKITFDLYAEQSYTVYPSEVYPGKISGLVTFTNAHYPFKYADGGGSGGGGGGASTTFQLREKFPETWIFENYEIDANETKLTLQIPDTITTWRITAFSNNHVTGFGIVNNPTDITVIQPFFISINLPFSVKRGEILKIPVTIFNYHNHPLEADVVLQNFDEEFLFMESNSKNVQTSSDDQQQIKHVSIPANKAKAVNFLIYPLLAGEISIGVTAESSLYSDAVLHKLKVEPEGVPKQTSQSLYLSIPEGEKINSNFSIEQQIGSVPESEYITFSVGGNYLVPTVDNFHDLTEMPTGSGEQNMVNFAPSVLTLQYLKANGKLLEEKQLVEELHSAIELSYQQQLSFRHENGGYSVFGQGVDEEPSTWLTAYVVRFFIKASKFLDIEEKVIETDLEYLAQQQTPNGEFSYTGYALNPSHSNKYGLTAFILLAFLEDQQYASKYEKTIKNGVEFLNSNLDKVSDTNALCLIASVIKTTKHQNANILINQLKSSSKENSGLKWWSANDQNMANDVEVTACAAITLLDTPGDHTSILKWLIEQRNAKGGFTSAFDTVVGMEALVKFSEKYRNVKNLNLKISYSATDEEGNEVESDEFYVDSNDDILDLQEHELPKTTRHVNFQMEGIGAALVQLSYECNVVNVQEIRHFDIKPKAVFKNEKEIDLEVCFTYQSDSNMQNEANNLIIMEANLPSGFRSDIENRLAYSQNDIVQKIESKNSESTIIFYLNNLKPNSNHCLDIPANKVNEVLMPKPAAIKIDANETKLTLQIPDTITTWRITAFSNNHVTGFGIVNNPTDITVIQPFFISINLPFSVKRGEILKIPVTIFNYHNHPLEADVVLQNFDEEFLFMESNSKNVQTSSDDQQQIKHVSIPANKAKAVNFLIYPLSAGEISIGVTAESSLYSDAVLHKLKVEPEGVPKQTSQSLYLSIPEGEKINSNFSIEQQIGSVPESEYITFSVGGNYLVPTVENFQDLTEMPTGSGEQNMVNFAASVLTLQYLKANGKLLEEKQLVEKLHSAIELSYQQQLSFRHENGGYSVFGQGVDEEPSTWLTAYVVRFFIKASKFLDIEEKVIETDLEYLAQQTPNGEFSYTGYALNPSHSNKYGLTAFILLAFLEDQQYASKYEKTINNGVEFLNSNLDKVSDTNALCLIASVIKNTKHQNANTLINQLKSSSKENNGLKWWSANDQNMANDVEVTACAAITLLDTPGDHTSILKWLIEQRNAKGGFTSAFDTVVGMEALVKFSEKYRNVKNLNLKISYSATDEEGNEVESDEFYVDSNDDILDLQEHELPKTTRHVNFQMEGIGAALVQLSYECNVVNVQEIRHFDIKPKAVFKNEKEIDLEVCFTYQSDSNMQNEANNLIIMEANLPSGFRSDIENSLAYSQNDIVQKIESKNAESTIIFYLNNLKPNSNHCLDIPANKVNEVLMPKPAAIKMYDCYNLSRSNTEFYTI